MQTPIHSSVDKEMMEWAGNAIKARPDVFQSSARIVEETTTIAPGLLPVPPTQRTEWRGRAAATCPPTGAPTHVSVGFIYATLEDYVTDCNDTPITVSGSGSFESDLSFSEGTDGCTACFGNGEDEWLLTYACPDPNCSQGNDGQYYYSVFVCVQWDGSTYRAQITSNVRTDEDFGICSWSTDNGNNLAASQWIYADLDLGTPITGVSIDVPLEKDGHIDSTLTLNFS